MKTLDEQMIEMFGKILIMPSDKETKCQFCNHAYFDHAITSKQIICPYKRK